MFVPKLLRWFKLKPKSNIMLLGTLSKFANFHLCGSTLGMIFFSGIVFIIKILLLSNIQLCPSSPHLPCRQANWKTSERFFWNCSLRLASCFLLPFFFVILVSFSSVDWCIFLKHFTPLFIVKAVSIRINFNIIKSSQLKSVSSSINWDRNKLELR